VEAKTFGRSRKSGDTETSARSGRERKALTIGAVCKTLKGEFPDVSISKIRYLEDQQLLTPRRTQGGYRLYSPADVSRLRTILRLQRDEFLPLRVIRTELAAGRAGDESAGEPAPTLPGRPGSLSTPAAARMTRSELAERSGVDERLLSELEEFGVIRAAGRDSETAYDDVDREIVRAVAELKRYGAAGRNLRVFRGSAEREAALLEQMLGAALRSPNQEKRKEAVESLENLAAVVSRFQHLLLIRDLRRLVD
jgi:DNA-binding transcriptional MerR regulator